MQRCLRKICRAHFDWILVVRLTTDGRTHDSILVERRDYFSLDKWLPESLGAGWNWNGKQQQITDLSARYKIGAGLLLPATVVLPPHPRTPSSRKLAPIRLAEPGAIAQLGAA